MNRHVYTIALGLVSLVFFGCESSPVEPYPIGHNTALVDQVPKAPSLQERSESLAAFAGSDAEGASEAEDAPAEAESAPVTVEGNVAKVTLVVQNGLAYSHGLIRIPAGAKKVEVTLEHQGTVPVTAMGHNVVFLKDGTDAQAFSQAAVQARDNGYIPNGMRSDMIAHTKMIGGGEKDTVSFDVPKAGTYEYLCSFPGHYPLMKGQLVIES
ncbi:MAG: plastocyanin/azurin family copper-binding protein [Myxococcota bacterium]